MNHIVYSGPMKQDTSSFYRGWGPLCHISKCNDDLRLLNFYEFDWAQVMPIDVFVFPRPHTDGCVESVKTCKRQDKFVWIDYDDSFVHIPKTNPCYKPFVKALPNVATLCDYADLITTSTRALAEDFKNFKNKVTVIPNAYPNHLFGEITAPQGNKKIVLWRGSPTHQEDLSDIAAGLVKIANSDMCSDWRFVFMGYNPIFITSMIKEERVVHVPDSDIFVYFNDIKRIEPSILIVPLRDNQFNRCKSNIAWLEATHAGAMCIASDLPEFRKPGVMLTDQKLFARDLEQAIKRINEDGDTFVKNHWDHSKAYIEENLYLTEVNKTREAIIRTAIEGQMAGLSRRTTITGRTSIPGHSRPAPFPFKSSAT